MGFWRGSDNHLISGGELIYCNIIYMQVYNVNFYVGL